MYYDAGKVVTCGSRIRKDCVATTTSTALQRLKSAGTVRLGTLRMAEFAYGPTGHNSHFGAVGNPWNTAHVTGGSSSGSGAAVAACLTFAALGSDTGGSIRMPAHFCGVTGLEDHRRTDQPRRRDAAVTVARHRRTAGAHGRRLRAAARLDGRQRSRRSDRFRRRRARLPCRDQGRSCRTENRRARPPSMSTTSTRQSHGPSTSASQLCRREGANVIRVTLPEQRRLTGACQIVLAVEAAAFHKAWMIERPQEYGPQVLMRLQNGLAIPAVTYLEAMRWRGTALAEHLAAVEGLDAVIAPTAPMPAPTIVESDVGNSPDAEAVIQRLTRFTRPVNYLGLPSLAIPAGFTDSKPAGRHAADRPSVRRGDAAADRRGLPARDRFPQHQGRTSHDQSRRRQEPQCALHRRAHGLCDQRSEFLASGGRGAGPARRIRLGQKRHAARIDAAVAEEAHASSPAT